jgi:ATP-dependent helicase/nuclease subunit A
MTELPDSLERERAATTFDRNVVVTAGAGTGKTRLLIDRLVHLLMRDPETKLTQIVALTFTNKAATEMKVRLRERLQSYVAVTLDAAAINEDAAREEVRNLMARYHLTKEALDRRVLDALRQIERSEIGTIHSFAATLLRLYPMESGVDPQFVEDDGARFDRLFDEHWGVWLDEELSYRGTRQEEWKQVLRKVRLDEVRALAASFCSETVDLERLDALSCEKNIPDDISLWLGALEKRASGLLERHPENRSNEKLIRASRDVLQKTLRSGDAGDSAPDFLSGGLNRKLKGWNEEDYREAQEIFRIAKALCNVDDSLSRSLAALLIPFAEHFREAFTRAGLISFDGLLARARTLVRDRLAVREQLKRRFQAILIDEFQDTDPIQYEILVYLAEEIGKSARNWRDVRLTPGKIFVVGDPKQSIYAFRRADIQAYLEVVEKIIKAQNGIDCRLTTNFRSHGKILDAVNGIFDRMIRPKEGLQPEYVAIEPAPTGDGERAATAQWLPFRKVAIRVVRGNEVDKQDTELARRLEAESLARWLDEEVLGKAEIADRDGKTRLVQPKDVAILFRKLTDVHHYLEPLRRRGLGYVVEGERHFYAVQEIIDAVNLLRAVDNPHDRLALVGALRSPLGGLADAEIYDLHRRLLLDYRVAERKGKKPDSFSKVKELYEILCRLNRTIRALPVGEAIGRVFDSLPVRLLAAGSFHGEQAVANLEKLRYQAEVMGREGLSTFKEVVTRFGARVLEIKEEAESALAEENLDAIRILSIHKSKGLEFPVVVLAGCHTVPQQAGAREPAVLQDWSSGLAGLCTESYWSLPGLYIAERARQREQEEHKRVLYVAMTRAREHLMISCAPAERKQRGSYLSMLEENLAQEITAGEGSRIIAAGAGTIEVEVVDESLRPPGKAPGAARAQPIDIDWESYTGLWQRRAREYEAARAPLFLTPTLLKLREAELTEALPESKKLLVTSELSLVIGELAHRFLEAWDFGGDPAEFRAGLDPFLDRWIEPKRQRNRGQLRAELEQILATFFSSAAYRDLSGAEILGREVPLLIPWNDGVMEGVIDLLYEKDGRLFLADYKTDRLERSELAEAASRYHHQVEIYSEAARRVLKKDIAGFNLIFLRLGESVNAL